MNICLDCGREFDEPQEVKGYVGEFWGVPAYEVGYYCPYCGGDYEEVTARITESEDEEDDDER